MRSFTFCDVIGCLSAAVKAQEDTFGYLGLIAVSQEECWMDVLYSIYI